MIDPVGVMVIYVYDNMYKDDGVVELGIVLVLVGRRADPDGGNAKSTTMTDDDGDESRARTQHVRADTN